MRHHRHVWMLFGVVCLLVAGVGGGWALLAYNAHAQPRGSASRSSAIGSPSCYQWAAYAGPGVASTFNNLTAITEVPGSHQLWAVGQYIDTDTELRQTLIEHYDGASWSVVPSPSVAGYDNYLMGITAISANDVWAAGYIEQNTIIQTLIEEWNGSSWSIVASPNPYPSESRLFGVAAVSANDVWAVGSYFDTSVGLRQTLIEQWDGSKWSVIPSPNGSILRRSVSEGSGPYSGVQGQNYLYGVSALSSSDAWAVGSDGFGTLTEHWNGASWNLIASPSITNSINQLTSVAATASSDVMAIGAVYPTSGGVAQTLAERWNGTTWSIVSSPNLGTTGFDVLRSITAVPGTNRFIAVGSAAISSTGTPQTLMEQWDGSSWRIASTPNHGAYANSLNGIVAGAATDVWAVGNFESSATDPAQPLIERYIPNAMGLSCSQ